MAKAKVDIDGSAGGFYQGSYVTDMVDLLVASALSGRHAVLLSTQGKGKTRIAKQVANAIYGKQIDPSLNGKSEGNWVFLRLEASTPPEKVQGLPDPAKMIETPPTIVLNRDGTMYDKRSLLFVVDEIFRPNDVVFDTLLDGLDKQDEELDSGSVVWGSSNFVASGARLAAVLDRIALWGWFDPVFDFYDIAMAHLMRGVNQDLGIDTACLPTIEQIMDVRKMRPDADTAKLIASFVKKMSIEAASMNQPEHVNPRRAEHWQRILYTVSAFYNGSPNFSVIHPMAIKAIKNAWPSAKIETYRTWGQVIDKISDTVGSAIQAAQEAAYSRFNAILDQSNQTYAGRPLSFKIEKLGETLAQAQRVLSNMNDERANVAIENLTKAYADAAKQLAGG